MIAPTVSSSDAEAKFIINNEIEFVSERSPAIYEKMRSTQSTYYLEAVISESETKINKTAQPVKEAYNLNILESFKHLQDNWNGNGATRFNAGFIDRVQDIVLSLDKSPDIFPTGRNSIQLEYEKQNGDYLEFEIYEDERINCFQIINDIETATVVNSNQLNGLIQDFYAA